MRQQDEQSEDLGFHAFIRGIILLGFALLMIAFIVTGGIRYYIAPTMMPFIYFAAAVFLVLAVIQIFRSTSKGQKEEQLCDCGADHSMGGSRVVKLLIYSIFIAPIIAGFVLPDKVLDSSVAANRGIQFSTGMNQVVTPTEGTLQEEASTSRAELFLEDPEEYYRQLEADSQGELGITAEEYYTDDGFNEYYRRLADQFLDDGVILVTDENYLDVMTMLEAHLQEFQGMEIDFLGFVYREPSFANNQLVVARFGMTCCVADATVYGTMLELSGADQFENDTWVQVSGTISQTNNNGEIIPNIKARGIQVIDEPDIPYVFPTFRF